MSEMRPNRYLLSSSAALSSAYDTLLLDLDGTTYLGALPAPNAPAGLAAAKANGARAMYLTNNSGRPPAVVAAQLDELGIPTAPEEVLNSSQVAEMVAEQMLPPGTRVYLSGGEGLREAFADSPFTVVASADEHPEAVVQGLNEQTTWRELSEAVLALAKGASVHLATNLDATIPKERGPMIGNGSFVACVQNATGSHPINCGKPERHMFDMAVLRAQAKRPLAVGDRLDTDLAGAVAAGIPGFHVLTGVSSARDVLWAIPAQRPSFLGVDLRDLNEPHPPVAPTALTPSPAPDAPARNWWHCGGWAAAVKEGALYIDGTDYAAAGGVMPAGISTNVRLSLTPRDTDPPADAAVTPAPVMLTLDAYRAAACAMWEAADQAYFDRSRVTLPEITVIRKEKD